MGRLVCKEPAGTGGSELESRNAEVHLRISLFHNEDAGDGSSVDDIKTLFTRHGHRLVQVVGRESRVEEILESHADLVVAAGGDGTVATAARVVAGRKLPLAILPLGTANNIAKSLGCEAPIDDLVDGWARTDVRLLDLGFVRGEWGEQIFFESVGAGLIPFGIGAAKAKQDMSEDKDQEGSSTAKPEDAVKMFRDVLAGLEPQPWTLVLDGKERTGEFLLVEVLNMPSIGPNLVLSDQADPRDGFFSVVIATEAERAVLDSYLEQRMGGSERPLSMPPTLARQVEIRGSSDVHVDDQLLHTKTPHTVSMTIEPEALKFLPGPCMVP